MLWNSTMTGISQNTYNNIDYFFFVLLKNTETQFSSNLTCVSIFVYKSTYVHIQTHTQNTDSIYVFLDTPFYNIDVGCYGARKKDDIHPEINTRKIVNKDCVSMECISLIHTHIHKYVHWGQTAGFPNCVCVGTFDTYICHHTHIVSFVDDDHDDDDENKNILYQRLLYLRMPDTVVYLWITLKIYLLLIYVSFYSTHTCICMYTWWRKKM